MAVDRIIDMQSRRGIGLLASGCVAVVLLLPVLYTIVSFFVLPSIYSDSAAGFLAWDSMQRGAPFNYVLFVDPTNISLNGLDFLTFWAPGQYLSLIHI